MTDQFQFDNPIIPGSIWNENSDFMVPVVSPVGAGPKGEKGDAAYFDDLTEEQLQKIYQEASFVGNKSLDEVVTTTGSSTTTIPIPWVDYDQFDMLFIDVNGLDLSEHDDYEIVSGNIVLTTPLPAGQDVHFRLLRYDVVDGSKSIMNIVGRKDYNTVAEMQADKDLEPGDICHTLGFHAADDSGAAWYKIMAHGVANGMDILDLENDCIAVLQVTESYVTPEMFGAYGDGVHGDDSAVFQRMIDLEIGIDGNNGTYLIKNQLTPTSTIRIKNCVFDFNNECAGFFTRLNDSDIKSPLKNPINYAEFINCEFKHAIDVGPGSRSYSAALPITAKKAKIEKCTFHDNNGNGLMFYGEDAEYFKHIVVSNCIAYLNGIYDTQTSIREKTGMGIGSYQDTNSNVTDVSVDNCIAYQNANSGIGFHGLNNVKISNCFCHDNYEHGFTIQSALNGSISNCVSNNNRDRAFRIQGDWNVEPVYCKNITVTNCTSNGSSALGIGGGCENIHVSDNVFNIANATNAIAFDPYVNGQGAPDKNIVIENNIFNMTDHYPITGYMFPSDLNVMIINNVINGVIEPLYGCMINYPEFYDGTEPGFIFGSYEPNFVGLKKSKNITLGLQNVTNTDNVYTASASGGYIFTTRDIQSDDNVVGFFVKGKFNTIKGAYAGSLSMQLRDSGNVLKTLTNRPASQGTFEIGKESIWFAFVNIEDLKTLYPATEKLRILFSLTTKDNVFELDDFGWFSY